MFLDRIIKRLLPTDSHFYDFFEESTQNIVAGTELMRQMVLAKSLPERDKIARQIKILEHQCDAVTHKVFSELNSTFVTPFDREDIHELASALDDIMDHIDGSASRLSLYKIKKCPESMVQLVDVLHLSVEELLRGVRLLRRLHEAEELNKMFKTINEYENEADTLFEQAIAELFDKEKDTKQIIKLKEVFTGLETATDKCEDAANVLETIYIKHA
ncbi:MAG: DUF47 family protein [Ignavibacteriales bacterium]|nr:DUF47 family protein [Ignavibacteriales bacterium]